MNKTPTIFCSSPDTSRNQLRTFLTSAPVCETSGQVKRRYKPMCKTWRIAQARIQGGLQDLSQQVSGSLSINERVKDALVKMVPPAIYVATIGCAIDALGLIRTWVMLAYLCIAIAVVVGMVIMGRFKTDASDRLGDLCFRVCLLRAECAFIASSVHAHGPLRFSHNPTIHRHFHPVHAGGYSQPRVGTCRIDGIQRVEKLAV